MPSSYTTSLRLTLPATGELQGQWGNTVNTGITELLDAAVAGTASISTWGGAGIPYTLSNNSGTADEARRMFIVATGAPGEAKNVVCPAVSKFYVLRNDTTGGFALTLKTPSGSGISVPAGQYKFLYCNGTDVVEMFNSAGALTLSGALSVGGTTTLAGNPTLSAGTANGVLYLNGSKVATSGTALTFDGTNLGVGAAPLSGIKAYFAAQSGNNTVRLDCGPGGASISDLTFGAYGFAAVAGLRFEDANALLRMYGDATRALAFNANGSEQMRLTSTGLGIGTSSPNRKLEVNGISRFTDGTSNVEITNGGGVGYVGPQSNHPLAFQTNNVERMRLDPPGNLGLGVAPSAWSLSGLSAMQIRNAGFYGYDVTEVGVTGNSYYGSSAWRYIQTGGAATRATQVNGSHQWYTAPSGTAGNAISFTQAMTLDASGNLLVNRTSVLTGSKVSVDGSLGLNGASGDGVLRLYTAGTQYGGLASAAWAFGGGASTTDLALSAVNSLMFGAGNTERARITSGGLFGIGVDPSYILHVAGGASTATRRMQFDNNSATGSAATIFTLNRTSNASMPAQTVGLLAFNRALTDSTIETAGSIGVSGDNTAASPTGTMTLYSRTTHIFSNVVGEAARITSGGDFVIGATAAVSSEKLYVNGSNTEYLVRWYNTNASPKGLVMSYTGAAPNGTGNAFLRCDDTGALRAEFRSNGGLANYSANDVNLSDRREKTNFAPAKSYLDTICAIPVQTFNYIDQSPDDPGLTLGVVAQDVQAVAPELVMESNWGTADEPKQRLSIYQTDLQYALMKCIQEQQALITALTARVAALESN